MAPSSFQTDGGQQRLQRRRREHFIPTPRGDLVETFVAELAADSGDRRRLEQFCELLAEVVHRDFHRECDELKQAYLPFDPDADTQPLQAFDAALEQERYNAICDRLQQLLLRANFRRLSRQDIDAALSGLNEWGVNLQIDFGKFERLDVYARGDVSLRKRRRHWRALGRFRELDVPVFQRLAVVFRLCRRQTPADGETSVEPLFIKLFKDIPQSDIESLLPGSRIRMTWLDRSRILLPTLSGIGFTIVKLVQGALALMFAGVYGLLAFLGVVGGTIGYGMRSFYGYLRTRDKYQLHLTRNLYYQNLDNNRGAILRMVDEAEEQEFREVLLAYFLLWRDAPPDGWTAEQLDGSAESWLQERLGDGVDFEIRDALKKLEKLRLAESDAAGRWRAAPLDSAFRELTESNRLSPVDRRSVLRRDEAR